MRRAWLLLALLLAGCASDAPREAGDDFEDVEVEVDEQTGAIRGVVVDASITPLADVKVVLKTDPPQEQTTDELGRFVFNRLPPGFYLLNATKPLYAPAQIQTSVEAGVAEPPVVRIQLTKLFSGEPFVLPFSHDGYFTCSQANFPGYLYSSSPCHSLNVVDLDDYGIELPQERVFHSDVGPGWQTQVFEMTWDASLVGTSERMGMSVSTYHPERNTNHWFASVSSGEPLRFQLDVGTLHETAQEGSGPDGPLPADGMTDMSYYISVRSPEDATCAVWCVPPGLALEQDFHVYLHQFYYLPAPDGWSIVAGDSPPY